MSEQIRILCVDDEPNVLRAVQRIFLDDDYEILTAPSAAEGLKVMESGGPIQIVISDYRMPEMNGVDLLSEVCRRWPDTVRIVLSGYADTAAIVAAINEGQIYKFIAKPWNDDELRMSIGNAVDLYFLNMHNRELTRELTAKNAELSRVNAKLEKLVAEVTSQVVLQNRVIEGAQNILDALPVAVIGLDTNGDVVMCNQEVNELFGPGAAVPLGAHRKDFLPAEVNAYLDRLQVEERGGSWEEVPDTEFRACWTTIGAEAGTGVVVVFDRCGAGEQEAL